MQFLKLSVLAALAATVSAITVTTPADQANVDFSKSVQVQWTSVSTDPTSFSVQLVNNAVYPNVMINIADNVQTSAGSFTIPPQSGIATGANYQVDLVSKVPQNQGILAQSQHFTVTAVASSSSSSTSGSTSSTSSSTGTKSTTTTTSSGSSSTGSSTKSSSTDSSSSSTSTSTDSSGSATVATTSATSTPTGNTAAHVHIVSGAAGLGFVAMVAAMFA